MSSARPRLSKHITLARNMHTRIEELLGVVFSMESIVKLYREDQEDSVTVRWQKNMVMSPVGPGTKNGCAGEGQQQFSRQPDGQKQKAVNQKNIYHGSHKAQNQK